MIKVNNKKVITKLAIRSFKASKSRNFIAIVAIALTTILFTSIFTIGGGMLETIQNQTFRQIGGDGHIALKYLTEQQFHDVKDHPLIKKITFKKIIADEVENIELLKRMTEMYYMDVEGMKLGFCFPTNGRVPEAANEIITDSKTLKLLGVPLEVGSKVHLQYRIKEKLYESDFILSGWWESDDAINVGKVLVSKAFVEENNDILTYTFKDDYYFSGAINATIMCSNSLNLEKKMERIITESGYEVDEGDEYLPNTIACNVNFAYIFGGNIDPVTAIGVVMACLTIIFAGYLIIYNIFQISVLKDIKFYGLLKTIGTTSAQIKKIIAKQVVYLSVVGIPLGLVCGFVIGKAVLPYIINVSTFEAKDTVVSLNPIIFIGASLFSFLTIILSIRKPGVIASKVSPIEAVSYNSSEEIKKAVKKSKDGGKIYRMAFSNLTRNVKRTVVTIISLSLSFVLFNSLFTVTRGFSMDKFVSKFVDTDFLIAHAEYFRSKFSGKSTELTEDFIEQVEKQEGFEEGGRLYTEFCSVTREVSEDEGHVNYMTDGKPILALYGLEDLPLSRLKAVDGTLDFEKLATGKYILEGLYTDDYDVPYFEMSHHEVGDIVQINVDGISYEYELMAKVKINYKTNSCRYGIGDVIYIPAKQFLNIVKDPVVMSYAYNVADEFEHSMEAFLKNYTSNVDFLTNYESKEVFVSEFKEMSNMILLVGGILSAIVALIGILNFINSIFTSILTRKREFATLQSIGMTNKQLITLLIYEGLYYALGTAILSLVVGSIFSISFIGEIVGSLWFFEYQFVIVPMLLAYPILALLSVVIPVIAYYGTKEQSVVERLREM